MTNRTTLFSLFIIASVTTTAFASSENDEQIARACKPYLQQYAATQMPYVATPVLEACYNTPNICNTNALSGMTDCMRKLNTWEFNKPSPPQKPAPAAPPTNSEPFTEGTPVAPPQIPQVTPLPPAPAPTPAPAVKPFDYYSTPNKPNTAPTPADKNTQKNTTGSGINWF